MDFADQVVLITGASTGIGRCLAIDFAKRGAIAIGCARSRERLEETLHEIRGHSPQSKMIPCDVGDSAQVQRLVGNVLDSFGRIDILINNAGVGMRERFAETSVEAIEIIMRTNYFGMIYCTHAVLPSMITAGAGHIVNISSVAGMMGMPHLSGYCASKFAMNGFSECLYYELKPLGIHVSLICPGPVRTGFSRGFAYSRPKSPEFLILEPGAVSRLVIGAIEQKKFQVVMPWSLALIARAARAAPDIFRAIARRAFRSSQVLEKEITM
jgi:short-subunit dehydrogenase